MEYSYKVEGIANDGGEFLTYWSAYNRLQAAKGIVQMKWCSSITSIVQI